MSLAIAHSEFGILTVRDNPATRRRNSSWMPVVLELPWTTAGRSVNVRRIEQGPSGASPAIERAIWKTTWKTSI
jgi:hypothetical protein